MKVVSVKTLFFPCCETNFAHCLFTVLHSLFRMKGQHLHPYHPQLNAPLRHDEKNFNSIRKAAKNARSCLHYRLKAGQMKFFIKFEKDMTTFNLMSNLNG